MNERACRNRTDPVQWRTYLSLYRLFWSLWYPQWHQSPHRGRWSAKRIRIIVLKPLQCRIAWVKLSRDFHVKAAAAASCRKRAQLCSLAESWGSIRSHQIPSDPSSLQDRRLIPPTSLFSVYSYTMTSLFNALLILFQLIRHFGRDVTRQILLFLPSLSFNKRQKLQENPDFLPERCPWFFQTALWDRDGRGRELRGAAALRCSIWGSGRWCGDAALSGAAGVTSLPLLSFFISRMGLGPHWCWEEPVNKFAASVFGFPEVWIRDQNYESSVKKPEKRRRPPENFLLCHFSTSFY